MVTMATMTSYRKAQRRVDEQWSLGGQITRVRVKIRVNKSRQSHNPGELLKSMPEPGEVDVDYSI